MYILFITFSHTFRKCKNLAMQNTLQILLINDANMIGDWRTLGNKNGNAVGMSF